MRKRTYAFQLPDYKFAKRNAIAVRNLRIHWAVFIKHFQEQRMLAGLIALMLAAIFTGAAVYVSFVEQPARMLLATEAALAEWQPSYKRGAVMQAGLAVIAFVAAAAAWWLTRNWLFALGAVFQILPWPWTLLVILPTNKALLATNPAQAGPESHVLLEKWGRLHAMRTALGCAATLSFLVACLTFPAFGA